MGVTVSSDVRLWCALNGNVSKRARVLKEDGVVSGIGAVLDSDV
jgi:hypothetical protein